MASFSLLRRYRLASWISLIVLHCSPGCLFAIDASDSWVVKAGGAETDALSGLTVTPRGEIVFTGLIGPAARFGTILITDPNANGFFLAKYDGHGEPVWVRAASGNLKSRGFSVATDAEGNIYATGNHHDALQLSNGVWVPATETQPGGQGRFTAAFSPSGEAQWTQPWSGELLEHPDGRALLNQITQAWEEGVVTSEFLLNTVTSQAVLSPLASGKRKSGVSFPDPFVLPIGFSPDGSILMSGELGPGEEVVLGETFSFLHTSTNASTGYVVRFAADGSPLSVVENRWGQLAVDKHTNLFIVFRPGKGVRVEKYDSEGRLQWERIFDPQADGIYIPPFIDPLSLASGISPLEVDADGNLFFATWSVIRALNPEGELIAQWKIDATAEGGGNIARFRLLPDGKVIIGGTFYGRLTIGKDQIDSDGPYDIFLAKVALGSLLPPVLSWTRVENAIIRSWPPGFVLQSATSLSPALWRDESSLSPVTVPIETGNRFFRLRSE